MSDRPRKTVKTLKEFDYFKAWLVFFLIGSLGGAFVGGILGGVLGAALSVSGYTVAQVKVICGVAGVVIGIPISYLTFRFSVAKMLLPKLRDDGSPPPFPAVRRDDEFA